jgi:digeranylgeranylglycerophospholipid reductase
MGGLMLVGDGARLVDPLLGAGIMNAMASGRMAGEIAAQAIKSGDVSARALKKYDIMIMKGIGRAIRRNYRVKQFVVKATDRQMSALLGSLQKTRIEDIPIDRIYKAITASGLPASKIIKAFL